MRRLTKEDILKGKNSSESIYIDHYGADVLIRPLTDGELSQVFNVLGSIPLRSDGLPDMDKIDIARNFEALRLVASLGIVNPKLTADEIADMKFGVPELIAAKILELSGVSSLDGAKKN